MSVMNELDVAVQEAIELVELDIEEGRVGDEGDLFARANFHARSRTAINAWPVVLPAVTEAVYERFNITKH